MTHTQPHTEMSNSDTLADTYRRYIACLNERRFDDLAAFVDDTLSYNGKPMTRQQYKELIASNVDTIPDLFFNCTIIVASHEHIAARIEFRCTPEKPFMGYEPTGQRIFFCEHVFYAFQHGKITQVQSMIDQHAVRQQLGA